MLEGVEGASLKMHKNIKENQKNGINCGLHCIKIKDFKVTAGDDSTILEHINFHIHCGQLTAVIGKNGAGKSTLIKAILGEIPHEGTIECRDMKRNVFQDIRIGYVPQYLNIDKNTPASVYDMFASYISRFPVFLWKKKSLYQEIKGYLRVFEAQDLIDKAIGDLSGGELQRVLLSLAITPPPNLLLLDEPVSGMDQNGLDLFYNNLDYLKKNYDLAVILISHDLEYIEKYADYVVLLDKSIKKEGTPKEVFGSREFVETFGRRGFDGSGI